MLGHRQNHLGENDKHFIFHVKTSQTISNNWRSSSDIPRPLVALVISVSDTCADNWFSRHCWLKFQINSWFNWIENKMQIKAMKYYNTFFYNKIFDTNLFFTKQSEKSFQFLLWLMSFICCLTHILEEKFKSIIQFSKPSVLPFIQSIKKAFPSIEKSFKQ